MIAPQSMTTPTFRFLLLAICGLLLAGCAFNLVHVNQLPTAYSAVVGAPQSFVLDQAVEAGLGTTYPTRLRSGTRWHQVGSTEHGAVFTTPDQIVTVEASHIYEAQLVVSNRVLTGFYLPVEKTFAPVIHAVVGAGRPSSKGSEVGPGIRGFLSANSKQQLTNSKT
jgi:hypothetical protein